MNVACSEKQVTHQSLGFHTAGKFNLNENLTRAQKQPFFAIKVKTAECVHKYICIKDQQIYVPATDQSRHTSLDSNSDLAKIEELARASGGYRHEYCRGSSISSMFLSPALLLL